MRPNGYIAALAWYESLPNCGFKQVNFKRYCHEEPSGRLVIIAPEDSINPPPNEAPWRPVAWLLRRQTWALQPEWCK